jgi:2-phospho-L-lactate guanylyltransferase
VTVEWVVLIPMKRLADAKSRLGCAVPQHRRSIARAMAETVVSTASRLPAVRHVVLVTPERWDQDAAPAIVVPEPPTPGLNRALAHAARAIASSWPGLGVAALLGDTAAGTTEEVGACLAAAAPHRRAVVADGAGTGTVMLTAGPGAELGPSFGENSRRAHVGSGAVDLTDRLHVPLLRRDLDTVADLAAVAGRLAALPRLDAALREAGWTGRGFETGPRSGASPVPTRAAAVRAR